jgi:hypothetical protein
MRFGCLPSACEVDISAVVGTTARRGIFSSVSSPGCDEGTKSPGLEICQFCWVGPGICACGSSVWFRGIWANSAAAKTVVSRRAMTALWNTLLKITRLSVSMHTSSRPRGVLGFWPLRMPARKLSEGPAGIAPPLNRHCLTNPGVADHCGCATLLLQSRLLERLRLSVLEHNQAYRCESGANTRKRSAEKAQSRRPIAHLTNS